MPTIWCAKSDEHVGKSKVGQKPTFPKGKRRINHELAMFLTNQNGKYFQQDDFLCTRCFETVKQNLAMNLPLITSSAMDIDDRKPERAAATTALLNISALTNIEMSFSDCEDVAPDNCEEEIMALELQLSRQKSLELLNNILSLVGLSSIRDIRNKIIVSKQVDLALSIIRQTAEQICDSTNQDIITDESDITINEAKQIVNNFKLLVETSDYDEQIRLLTLVPSTCGRTKITNIFHCSQHQARYSIYLRDADQILSLPVDLRGNIPFNPDVEKEIFDFYHRDDISRASPNKKDVLKNHNNPKLIRYMLMSIMEAYQQFVQENALMKVGKSKFASLKAKWIKTSTPHEICTCQYHQNPALLLDAFNKMNSSKLELTALINIVLCKTETSACYLQECSACSTILPSTFLFEQFKANSINEDSDITWMTWERNEKRTELQRHTTSIAAFLEKLDALWSKFLVHHFYTIEQREYIKKIKNESSEKGTAIIQLDFAQNFTLVSQSSVQSSYWSQKQATLFTVHIKMGNYVSDGASAHFKNSKNMLNLTYHESDFGLKASWTFSSTSHGKGPVDGIGAAVKSRATRYLLSGTIHNAFLSSEEFFEYTKTANDHFVMKGDLEPNRTIETFYIKAIDIQNVLKRTLERR
ncbi:unnamed protein product [Rotaria magnacalcarata]|uniref:Uncharacterized protein n=2 Tax=Rotaria magnacalcarata TaxID=392030 RepID=A0A8S2RK82_9BILA|nr:unnamed protein product [Rotaria magnacalcarata]